MDLISFLRQFKIGQFAIFDIVISYVGIYLIAPLLTKLFRLFRLEVPRSSWLWFTIPLGVLFHIIFRQNTPLNKLLQNPSQFYIPLIVLVFMMVMGIRAVKITK